MDQQNQQLKLSQLQNTQLSHFTQINHVDKENDLIPQRLLSQHYVSPKRQNQIYFKDGMAYRSPKQNSPQKAFNLSPKFTQINTLVQNDQTQSTQILLTLLEKSQRLAEESEQKLALKEKEFQSTINQLKQCHKEEVIKLKTEIKIVQSLKNIEAKDSFDSMRTQFTDQESRNKVIDKIRALLVNEMEQITSEAKQKENSYSEEIVTLKLKIKDLQNQIDAKEVIFFERELQHQQDIQIRDEIINQQNNEQKQLRDQYNSELEKLQIKNHLSLKENQQANQEIIISKESEDLKTSAFEELLHDFKQLQSVLTQHDETTADQLNNLLNQKIQSENFYIEKIKLLENNYKQLHRLQVGSYDAKEKVIKEIESKCSIIEYSRDIELEGFKNHQLNITHSLISQSSELYNSIKKSFDLDKKQISFIAELVSEVQKKIQNQQNINYNSTERIIQQLQQENHILRYQVDNLQIDIKNGQNDENQSLIRLKFALQNLLNDLRQKILTYVLYEKEQNNLQEQFEKRIQDLDQIHSKKEIEDSELIQQLTDELQKVKFMQRKEEQLNTELKLNMDKYREAMDLKDLEIQKLKQLIQEMEKKVQLNEGISKEECSSIISKVTQTHSKLLDKHYLKKIDDMTTDLKEKSEKLDELLVRYCRIVNRYKNHDQEQLLTWQSRQKAYTDQIQLLRQQLESTQDKETHEKRYQEMVEVVQDSIVIEQELLSKYQDENEKEYKRQIKVLDQEVDNLHQQKQQLVKIISDYEQHYTEVSKERVSQNEKLKALNDSYQSYLDQRSSGSLQDLMLKYENLVKRLSESQVKHLQNIYDQIVEQRIQTENDQQNLKETLAQQYLVVVQYMNDQIEQLKSQDLVSQKRLSEDEQQIKFYEKQLSQMRIEYYQMRELYEKQNLRCQESNSYKNTRINDNFTNELNEQLEKLKNCKKVPEINQCVRDIHKLVQNLLSDVEIDQRFGKYVQNERFTRLQNEIDQIKRQKEQVILQASEDSKDFNLFIKEYKKVDEQRLRDVEHENEVLINILSGNMRDKYKELKDRLKQYMISKHQDNSLLLAAATGIQTLNHNKSSQSIGKQFGSQLIVLSPNKSSQKSLINNTTTQIDSTMNLSCVAIPNQKVNKQSLRKEKSQVRKNNNLSLKI
ncbi:UNKNOWN [Stylonychia lemnae]|uniref:Uncharacterized protein n=1 Tax=Stylonychia lemnae TaxID=5949 RepID=A0A078AZ85_STYLE|nr:UNKNOWN [Stylonychia lemnae]|eukprot:CDW87760.1 UNKNOWN [Stylonychia lemnae]